MVFSRNVMISILRTDSQNPDFVHLVRDLDVELAARDGPEYAFYAQFNQLDKIKYVVLALENGQALGCGALKEFDPEAAEVKRMYTAPEARGRGVASQVLAELEAWAAELGYARCFLETGQKQPEAIALYQKRGYQRIPNYGQYAGVENSLCFEKRIQRPR
jgi:GNAT superfamily N-acetyltransferase